MKIIRFIYLLYAVLAVLIGSLSIAGGRMLGSRAPALTETSETAGELGGVERYLAHIATDKPIYRDGEKVYVRSVILSANGHIPMPKSPGWATTASFDIKGPKGDTITSGVSAIIDSVVGFSWDIPAGQAGGVYTVRISGPWSDAPAERKFDIRVYRAPRLKSQIVFLRDAYGPADMVAANLHVERAEGGVPAGAKVTVSARVDGEVVWTGTTTVNESGNATARFKLPAAVDQGDGVIAMIIQDGGTVETATKTIPIVLHTINLAMYPEGGDLVADLPNRVYFEARTPTQKPADIAGVIMNRAGKGVGAFRSEHEGRGRFSFVPLKGESYSLHVTEPAGIQTTFSLPPVKESGVVIFSTSDVILKQRDVRLRVAASTDGNYPIVLSQRGKEVAFKSIHLNANHVTNVALTIPPSVDGVIVATVYDTRDIPIAERLLFRQPEHDLKVTVVPDQADYVPGDKVTLRLKTTDDTGKPVGAAVGLTVTDSSVLEMIDKREQSPRLPVMVLLESEVHNLADAHVYLDENNPKAPLAIDLLLGTQGWRRFAAAGTGSLSGKITDWTGAVIPGVTVRALDAATGLVLTTITNETGVYGFPALKAGAYRVSAELPGFQTSTVGLQVVHNSSVREDLRLTVAMTADAVRVAGVGMGAGRGVLGGVLGGVLQKALPTLPLVGNDVRDERAAFKDIVEDAEPKAAPGPPGLARANLRKVADLLNVREYAHALRPNWTEGSRADFAETVYWNAGVKTEAPTGVASISFNLSDSVTSFRVLADAFAQDGSLGSGVSEITSVQPFSIEPKLPLQVTRGDVIQLPVTLVNEMSRELRGGEVVAKAPGVKITMSGDTPTTLGPKQRIRQFVQIAVDSEAAGPVSLTLEGKAGPYRDTVQRMLDVQPMGFPQETSNAGKLEPNASKAFEFTLPADVVRGSVSSSATVYPSPLASMTDALQALLQQPNGCFEQTSSISYPMVMAQQYFLTHTGVDPAIIEKAKGLLDTSYKRLPGLNPAPKVTSGSAAIPATRRSRLMACCSLRTWLRYITSTGVWWIAPGAGFFPSRRRRWFQIERESCR